LDSEIELTLSGAMTIAKMGKIICTMIDRGMVQAVISTGALIAHYRRLHQADVRVTNSVFERNETGVEGQAPALTNPRQRDPYLRQRVPRERLLTLWQGPTESARTKREIGEFSDGLSRLKAHDKVRPLTEVPPTAKRKGQDEEEAV